MGIYIIVTMGIMLVMVTIQLFCLYRYVLKIQPDFDLKLWLTTGLKMSFKRNSSEKKIKRKVRRVEFKEILNLK